MSNSSAGAAFLFLGAGAVFRDLYAPALAALGWLDRTIVVEPYDAAAASVVTNFPAVRVERVDWREGLARCAAQSDAVIVCLPTPLHEPAVREALAAGRSVLCEKPLTLDTQAGRNLCQLADDAGLTLQVCLPRRFLPSVRAAKAWLDSGLLGAVRRLSLEDGGPYMWNSATDAPFRRESGGVLADMAPHYLDLARLFVGRMQPVAYEDDAVGGVESDCRLALRAGDVDVDLRLSRTSRLADRILIACEHGALEIDRSVPDTCRVIAAPSMRTESEPAQPFESGPWRPSLQACFADVLLSFRNAVKAREGASSVRGHLDDIEAIAWAYATRERARAPAPARSKSRKVVVTGGTGFIGTHIVERLHAEGATQIVVPVRRFNSAAEVSRWPVSLTIWDWDKPETFAASLEGVDTVFHLAFGGTPSGRSVTVQGTLDLLDAARKANVRRCVILSTMWVYGFPHAGRPVDESFPANPYGGEYAETKAAMELRVLEYCKSHARPEVVILNPTCVFGPRGGVYTRTPLELARQRMFCWVDDGFGIANYVYAGNLADAMILAGSTPGIHGERFIINDGTASWRELLTPFLGSLAATIPSMSSAELTAAPASESATFADIGRHMLRDAGLRRMVMRHPLLKPVARASKRMISQLATRPAAPRLETLVEKSSRAVPPDWLATVFVPFTDTFSSESARTRLGWKPALDLETAQAATVRWLTEALGLD